MKTVLITGSSRGIGAGIAQAFATQGYNIVINYNKNAALAQQLAQELSTKCRVIVVKADVSSSAEVANMFSEIKKNFGGVDILVNNAGVSQIALLTTQTDNDINNILDINLKGTLLVTRAAVPYMVSNNYGRIINISSMWGVSGASCEVVYSASKAGIIGFTQALAKELAPSGITVNCVAPGLIDTAINGALSQETLNSLIQDTPVGRIGTPGDVANAVMFFASDASSFITAQSITVDGGFM